ncbi:MULTISPECIES: NAD(P)H-dependent flavin oxidoreductase [Chryseobacterium]|uniref:Enoyl-[acyl-carrier protein] reductase II n=1 Tax=Chryseobacterium camelliae TaxID=1265445 RepID=A0ABU0TE38_9FLAO|nr:MULTISPECIES: nitronate monooxygenase [Chryseobacterium]MDT3406885.1 enoyl-[acyl-carrier protein] reductase II [Pseudacidovorax intermedius]MDQ1095319.1 enoyl-[acyl-carrier protein] reductase II [Chryseobacterium camelliae]MDQ1099258.1 enoyl-[acyl-carrier protein] reductase II [Chryseobacterium sp. SORGH_AS_1048]MDR6086607.1 enoyl-[acyl-carrier protein] reductase II [Chryseobacterium sp. SORGH_AS_0909]MDR6130977.1 enoyl-[acyl-carrier protein] reductase II [Chryseobacterium sp. SORGH_AS_1175
MQQERNRVTALFNIQYPIIQAGMIWHSGWRLASAVSNCGGLGLIGAGSMYPDVLRENIRKCRLATDKPFGVNVPMLYPNMEEVINIILEEGVKIVFTSAGNPKTYTETLQKEGLKVAHVVSSTKFAVKCEDAGVDAIVAEGFEAGGHNGRDETTTFCLIPNVKKHISKPLIAAGGIALGAQMKAAMILGADGVQIGSRFAATVEASAHDTWKKKITELQEGDTHLTLKELAPVRMVKNKFFNELEDIYATGRNTEALITALGRARAKRGMFEGDMEEGELEIGQVSALIDDVLPVETVFNTLLKEFDEARMPSF